MSGQRGPSLKANPEVAFEAWYNGGDRRTLVDVARDLGVSYMTMRRYADDGDWLVRADELDRRIQAETDARISALVARQRARNIEALVTLKGRFFMRLPKKITDPETGAIIHNPAYLAP